MTSAKFQPLSALQTIRIQSSEGNKRILLPQSATTEELYDRVRSSFQLNTQAFQLCLEKDGNSQITRTVSRTLKHFGLHHGDLLYLQPKDGVILFEELSITNNPPAAVSMTHKFKFQIYIMFNYDNFTYILGFNEYWSCRG